MSLKLRFIGQIEHGKIAFEDAVTTADTFNGAFGDVSAGKFTVGAKKSYAIMQLECGDDADMPKYPIEKGKHVKLVNLEKCVGELIEVYDYPLPAAFAVGDKLESQADGSLKKETSPTALYLEVKEIIGNKAGVVALVAKGA